MISFFWPIFFKAMLLKKQHNYASDFQNWPPTTVKRWWTGISALLTLGIRGMAPVSTAKLWRGAMTDAGIPAFMSLVWRVPWAKELRTSLGHSVRLGLKTQQKLSPPPSLDFSLLIQKGSCPRCGHLEGREQAENGGDRCWSLLLCPRYNRSSPALLEAPLCLWLLGQTQCPIKFYRPHGFIKSKYKNSHPPVSCQTMSNKFA